MAIVIDEWRKVSSDLLECQICRNRLIWLLENTRTGERLCMSCRARYGRF